MLRVTDVDYIKDLVLYLEFSDGTKGEMDFYQTFDAPIFRHLREHRYFIQFGLTSITLEWIGGIDFAPEYLRDQVIKQNQMETVQ